MLWTQFRTHLATTQQDLYQDKHFTDVTLVSDDDIQVAAHKVVLSSCSSVLRKLLLNNPHPHPLLYLRGINHQHMQAIIQYMYCGEVRVPQQDINEFISICNDLKVKDLCLGSSIEERKQNADSNAEESNEMFELCEETTDGKQVESVKVVKLQTPDDEDKIPSFKGLETKLLYASAVEAPAEESMMGRDLVSYDPLPCSPYTSDWKGLGNAMVRAVLRKMLQTNGYRRSGRNAKLGVGSPPPGWPEHIILWTNYKGSTTSGLTVVQVTQIIIAMLEAAGLDPSTHVQPGGVAEYIHQEIGSNIIE